MHGVSVSDHGEKVTWPGYWEERQRKLLAQPLNGGLYAAVTARLTPHLCGSPLAKNQSPAVEPGPSREVFKHCRIWFDGRVDGEDGLSSFSLGKLARLHGSEVMSRLTKRAVTHVVCTQLSGAKERAALGDAASRGVLAPYFVRPEWITQSIAAGKRQSERRFSVLATVAHDAGVTLLQPRMTPTVELAGAACELEPHALPAAPVLVGVAAAASAVAASAAGRSSVIVVDASQPESVQVAPTRHPPRARCSDTRAELLEAESVAVIHAHATSLDATSKDEQCRAEDHCNVHIGADDEVAMTELDSDSEQELQEVVLE